jgi:ABC-type polar amino acid transport system ATPase subunit
MELLEVVGLQEFANVLPKYLSGGQQQSSHCKSSFCIAQTAYSG